MWDLHSFADRTTNQRKLGGITMKNRFWNIPTMFCILLLLGVNIMNLDAKTNPKDGILNAKNFGAKGDGIHDDTTAIQSAIDASSTTGNKLYIPAGKYVVTKELYVKPGATIEGAANSPNYNKPLTGTVILSKYGRDKENAPALFTMNDSSSVSGLTIYYPEQKADDIHPYAWTFHMVDNDNTLENITLINSYNAIKVGGEAWNVRHRIRSVYGCALRRGIYVDGCSDVGRIDNVHFHGHWWWAKEVGGAGDVNGKFGLVNQYLFDNLEAFVFGRTDWEYVSNTFVFIAKTGYRFIKTSKGSGSFQMTGIGADAVHDSVVVDGAASWWTILITNGQFASTGSDKDAIGVLINNNDDPAANAPIRLVNCSVLSPRGIVANGPSFVSLTGCFLNTWGGATGSPLIEATNGKLQVQGCTFDANNGGKLKPMPSIALRPGVKCAIITGNMGVNGVEIINEIGDKAIIKDNDPHEEVPAK